MEENNKGLVYVGKIIELDRIPDADFIVSATVVCGQGGKWRGVVRSADFSIGDKCIVFLPDSLVQESDDMAFLKSSGWRVKMRRFRRAPSEVVIMPNKFNLLVGNDVTFLCGVTKYCKPVPACLNGLAKGLFPDFIPKTDEPNYQRPDANVAELIGKPFYVSLKMDGSSTTAFKHNGEFGVCSRNLELKKDENNGYWKVAQKYKLEEKLPDETALQWETCGPGIQSNPMGLSDLEGYAFSAYNIVEKRYFTMKETIDLCEKIDFPMAEILREGDCFSNYGIEVLGEGTYDNHKQREGVVVRSQENLLGHKPISFKVINLNYEK
jgi:RNA ligase (TIGR02306 family)